MTTTRIFAPALVLASLALAACNGGGNTTGTASPNPMQSATAPANGAGVAPGTMPINTAAPSTGTSPLEGTWNVISLGDQPLPDGVDVTIVFRGDTRSRYFGRKQSPT